MTLGQAHSGDDTITGMSRGLPSAAGD